MPKQIKLTRRIREACVTLDRNPKAQIPMDISMALSNGGLFVAGKLTPRGVKVAAESRVMALAAQAKEVGESS